MEDVGVINPGHDDMDEPAKPRPGVKHLGIGVVAVMSLKGTATLTAAYFLPSWPLRFFALAIIVAIGTIGVVKHRRRRRGHTGGA